MLCPQGQWKWFFVKGVPIIQIASRTLSDVNEEPRSSYLVKGAGRPGYQALIIDPFGSAYDFQAIYEASISFAGWHGAKSNPLSIADTVTIQILNRAIRTNLAPESLLMPYR